MSNSRNIAKNKISAYKHPAYTSEPDHPTFNFVLKEDTVPDEFKAGLVAMMEDKMQEVRRKKQRRRKSLISAAAAAALILIALFATPLGQYVTSAAEDIFHSTREWTGDLFGIGKKGKTLEIESGRLAGDFMFVTVKTDSEVMLHCYGEIYDNEGNSAALYSGYDLSTRDDRGVGAEGSFLYATRKRGETMLYAPEMASVVNSTDKEYHCKLKVVAYAYKGKLLDITKKSMINYKNSLINYALDPIEGLNAKNDVLAGGIKPSEVLETEFEIPSDKLDSVLLCSRFTPDPEGKCTTKYADDKIGLKLTVKEGIIYKTASNIIVDIAMTKGRSAAGRVDTPFIYMGNDYVFIDGVRHNNRYSNDLRRPIYGDGHYYLVLDNICFAPYSPELPYSYERFEEYPEMKHVALFNEIKFYGCAEAPETEENKFSYESLQDISLPVSYDSVTGIEQTYGDISFQLTEGVRGKVKGLYKTDIPELISYDSTDPYYIPLELRYKDKQSFDLGDGIVFTNPGLQSNSDEEYILNGMLTDTGGSTVLSGQSSGKEIFRIRARLLFGDYTDPKNDVSFNACIIFGGIETIGDYDGHEFFNIDIDDVYSLRRNDGRFLSLAGICKKYNIDTVKIISIGFEKVSYSDAQQLNRSMDDLLEEGFSFQEKRVIENGNYIKMPLALRVVNHKRVKALNPEYYDLKKLRKSQQTVRHSENEPSDWER